MAIFLVDMVFHPTMVSHLSADELRRFLVNKITDDRPSLFAHNVVFYIARGLNSPPAQ